MDMNEYFMEWWGKERLAEARAAAARDARLHALQPPRRPFRVALGFALIGIGNRILGERADARTPLATSS